jgi:hypothetical protein
VFYAGKKRYMGILYSREQTALACEIAREKLKLETLQLPFDAKAVEAAVNAARVAAFFAVFPTENMPHGSS